MAESAAKLAECAYHTSAAAGLKDNQSMMSRGNLRTEVYVSQFLSSKVDVAGAETQLFCAIFLHVPVRKHCSPRMAQDTYIHIAGKVETNSMPVSAGVHIEQASVFPDSPNHTTSLRVSCETSKPVTLQLRVPRWADSGQNRLLLDNAHPAATVCGNGPFPTVNSQNDHFIETGLGQT
jgi:hypothetical protein